MFTAPLADLVARWFQPPDFVASGRRLRGPLSCGRWSIGQGGRQRTFRAARATIAQAWQCLAVLWLKSARRAASGERGQAGRCFFVNFGDPRLASGTLDVGNVAAGCYSKFPPAGAADARGR